jgi:hypothetical protein
MILDARDRPESAKNGAARGLVPTGKAVGRTGERWRIHRRFGGANTTSPMPKKPPCPLDPLPRRRRY